MEGMPLSEIISFLIAKKYCTFSYVHKDLEADHSWCSSVFRLLNQPKEKKQGQLEIKTSA